MNNTLQAPQAPLNIQRYTSNRACRMPSCTAPARHWLKLKDSLRVPVCHGCFTGMPPELTTIIADEGGSRS